MKDYHCLIGDRVHHYFWNQDLNCAVTTLKILSEIFDVRICSQVLDAATGLPGAGRFGAQCGLLEGSLMFIGILGKARGLTDENIVNHCRNLSNGFQELFGSLLCRELRPQGFSPENPPHLCEGLTKRAIEYAVSHIHGISGR